MKYTHTAINHNNNQTSLFDLRSSGYQAKVYTKKDSKINFADLFAGIGGMSLGLIQAGIDVAWAVEKNQFAAATFKINHPKTFVFRECIRKWFSKLKKITKDGKHIPKSCCEYVKSFLGVVHIHMSTVSVYKRNHQV